MANSRHCLLPALLLLCAALQLASADRYIMQTVLDCTRAHPACSSCSVKRVSANGIVTDSSLVCKSCASPAYTLFNDDTTSTCGEQGVAVRCGEEQQAAGSFNSSSSSCCGGYE